MVTGNGVGISVSSDNTVAGNTAIGNLQSGIHVGADSLVSGNTAYNNGGKDGGPGLIVVCASNVIDNTASGVPSLQLIGDGCNLSNNLAP